MEEQEKKSRNKKNVDIKENNNRNKIRTTKKIDNDVDNKKEEKSEFEIREVIVERKTGFNYAEVIVIMIITLVLGAVIGSFVTYVADDKPTTEIVKEVPEELSEFVKTYNNIISNYYEEVDHEKLLESGINGMLEYLDDDYSVYMDEEESKSFNEQVEGKYTGIGVEIIQEVNGDVYISRVFDNSPALRAGLQVGDVFVKVDNDDVKGKNASDISSLIKKSDKK